MKDTKQLTRILEGAILASDHPLSITRMQALFDEHDCPDKKLIRETLDALVEEYEGRGIELKELGSGFQFQVVPDLSHWVSRLWEERAPRYSRALLETLVLIAYRQPITRGEIEDVRGVAVSSNIIKTLMEREWIRVVGYRDVPGKPAILATTKEFLDYFGLKCLEDLPPLSEIQDLDQAGEKLKQSLEDHGIDIDEELKARAEEAESEEIEENAETEQTEQEVSDEDHEAFEEDAVIVLEEESVAENVENEVEQPVEQAAEETEATSASDSSDEAVEETLNEQ